MAVDGVTLLLFGGMMFFTLVLLLCEKFYPNDGQVFQVFAGLLSGFAGAFFLRVKPPEANPPKPALPKPPESV